MDKSIFSYGHYKTYLADRVKGEPNAGHGFRQKMAQAMNCQLAYVSQVLRADRDLSVEQAEALSRFLGHTKDEREYFVWLVQHERAGTKGAKAFFTQLLDEKREQYLQFKKRVDISQELPDSAKAIYYSDALYSATHMLLTIPQYRTPQAIADRFGVSLERIHQITEFLKQNGLAQEEKGQLLPTSKYLFIGRDSPFVLQHHTGWRMQALKNVARRRPEDLHLSMAITMGHKDAKALKQRIAAFVEEMSETIKASPEEKLMNFNLDFFEV